MRVLGRSGHKNPLGEFFVVVGMALLLALGIQKLIVKPFRIPSGSMENTLQIGQRVLADRVSFRFSDPERGDIVVFNPPKGADQNSCGVHQTQDEPCPRGTPQRSDQNFIKRIVGVPGDHLSVRNNHVLINGKAQRETFARFDECGDPVCNLPRPVTIAPDTFFMMGDNRGQSADSRYWGPVPKRWIIGRAFFTYWPPKRVGTL